MCGIYLSITSSAEPVYPNSILQQRLTRRGPDSYAAKQVNLTSSTASDRASPSLTEYKLVFAASVLSLRGSTVVTQPLPTADDEWLLLWNGEAWNISGRPIDGNDTEKVAKWLHAASAKTGPSAEIDTLKAVSEALRSIQGPYAVACFDGWDLYFARDPVGRRSLLYRISDNTVELTSVSDGTCGWNEVEAGYVHRWNSRNTKGLLPFSINDDAYRANIGGPSHIHCIINRHIPSEEEHALGINALAVRSLHDHLMGSTRLRLKGLSSTYDHTVKSGVSRLSRIAILFSGGLDCTVLARLAHDVLDPNEPIDLLNVAFENPRVHKPEAMTISPYEACPDRQNARESLAELQETCSGRLWRFVEINVPFSEYTQHKPTVTSLMAPHNTEMDLSIASALYFAARGTGLAVGKLHDSTPDVRPQNYATSAKVLLSGLGADELFGGYQRHATAMLQRGVIGLLDELELDISRLGKRNCGRDDRVISHWGREVRYPYLDENLVSWAMQEPVWNKCGFNLPHPPIPAMGLDKLVLRLLAFQLGLGAASLKKKRAIQFGARTAKMTAGRGKKGTDLLE